MNKMKKIVLSFIVAFIMLLVACGDKASKEFDLSSIRFTSKLYEYDGTEHSIAIEGKLPKGVKVSYSENKRTEKGSTVVTATFDCSNSKYEEIEPMTAVLSIASAEAEGLEYVKVADGVQITGYNDNLPTEVIIPDMIEGSAVVGIASDAFAGSDLYAIGIPSTVKSIDESAFDGCTKLESIVVAEGNEVYDSRDYCNALVETATNTILIGTNNCYIPETITTIGSDAYSYYDGIQYVYIPDNVTAVLDWAFYGCKNLKTLRLSNSLTSIARYTFYGCSSLEEINIPDNVITINDAAFSNCFGVKKIYISKSVMYIMPDSFFGCSSAESIVVDENNVAYSSYDNSNVIASVEYSNVMLGCGNSVIPSVQNIKKGAFAYSKNLVELYIPASIKNIEDTSFYGCANLTKIEVDQQNAYYDSRNDCNAIVDTLSNEVILVCNSTKLVSGITGIASLAFSKLDNLTGFIIPDNIKVIESEAFNNCSNLEYVVIPVGCSLKNSCFYYCEKLNTVYFAGNEQQWSNIYNKRAFYGESDFTSVNVYFYKETRPQSSGNYWHYEDNKPVVW